MICRMPEHEKLLKIALVLKDWEVSSVANLFIFFIYLMEDMGTAGQDVNIYWRKVIESILKSNWWRDG